MSQIRVLLVEDDQQIAKALSMNLSLSDYRVTLAATVAEATAKIEDDAFDILLLDVNLPDGDGLDLFHELRARGLRAPAIFLSARIDEETIVRAMNIGADDYIRKPFGVEELKIRMSRALKTAAPARARLHTGPVTLDMGARTATVAGRPAILSRREFDILAVLMKKAGDVVSREAIISYLEQDADIYDRTIDSHVSHLRRKIRELAGEDFQILPIYGVGYKLHWKA